MKTLMNSKINNVHVSALGEFDYIESLLDELDDFNLNEQEKLTVIRGFRSTSHLYGVEFNIKVSN